jgi:hypothetical protein
MKRKYFKFLQCGFHTSGIYRKSEAQQEEITMAP